MKQFRESIRNKALLALGMIVLVFFLVQFALVLIGAKLGEERANEQNQIKMNMLTNIISDGNTRRVAADEHIISHEEIDIRLVTNLLKKLVTEDGYTGPVVLPGGFVAKLRSGHVILPEEYREFNGIVTSEMIEKGLRSDALSVVVSPMPADQEDAAENGEASNSSSSFLSFEMISEDAVYVSVMTEEEYNAYLDGHSYNIKEALEYADRAFGGITLAVQRQDDELSLAWQIGMDETENPLPVLGITEETIREKNPVLILHDQEYLCSYNEIITRGADGGNPVLIQMLPQSSLREQNIKRALLVNLVMVMILLMVIVYVLSVQRYTAEHELTDEQARRYKPDRMRWRMLNVGILSILIVFILAILVESVGQLYVELRYGRDALQIVSKQLETINEDWQTSLEEEEESWYAYYGEEMATLLSSYPELDTKETLQESSEILGIDYIMLFDSDGKLTQCSRNYFGYTLTDRTVRELYDFHRLLYGMSGSISLDTSEDGVTGLKRHLIGVSIPSEKSEMHGALILALMPDAVKEWAAQFNKNIQLTVASGSYCFAADSSTGEILYSNAASMVGKTIQELGLPESSLRNGYMDLASISRGDYLVVTNRNGNWVYYFAVQAETLFAPVLQYGALTAVLFALVLALLLAFLLGGYNEKAYQEWTDLNVQSRLREKSSNSGISLDEVLTTLERSEGSDVQDTTDAQEETIQQKISALLKKISSFVGWDQMLPKDKMITAFRAGSIVLLIACLKILYEEQLTNESYKTMLGFLLHGDWMRGLNLFGLCSTLLILAIAYLVNLLSLLILKLTAGVASEAGQTVYRLTYSCIKYVTMFGVVYFGLGYLGFPASTIIASLSVVSLALSLGAQGLISDILAGLAVVFDRSFQVGDVVEINGTRGTIEEIGVRSTKMSVHGNNILTINNHEISNIVNMSKRFSQYKLDIRVSSELPLISLEEMLNRELPPIGRRCAEIIEGPYLIGVTELTTAGREAITLSIGAMIREKDSYKVKLFLNREIKLLFEREHINLM